MKFQLRVNRHSPDDGFIDYLFGPSYFIGNLFDRLYTFVQGQSFSDEYRTQVAAKLNKFNDTVQDPNSPWLMNFTVTNGPGYVDSYFLEIVEEG